MLNIKKVDENNFLVKKIGKYSIFITKIDSLYQGVYNYEIKVTDDFIAYWYSRTGWDRLPDNKRVREFCEKLEKRGVSATVRRELGRDISASCGQLRRSKLKGSDLE